MHERTKYMKNGVTHWREPVKERPPILKMRGYLGEAINEHRKQKKITLREIGSVSIGHLSEIERGKKEASSEVLEALCISMDLKLSELLRSTADKLEEVGK